MGQTIGRCPMGCVILPQGGVSTSQPDPMACPIDVPAPPFHSPPCFRDPGLALIHRVLEAAVCQLDDALARDALEQSLSTGKGTELARRGGVRVDSGQSAPPRRICCQSESGSSQTRPGKTSPPSIAFSRSQSRMQKSGSPCRWPGQAVG